ncbi:MAG: helix-turn-helix transcriptional regulator [Microgenomates group bacterium]|jgi:putative transcriptional regulator|nr:helix-turn-helix transcriptional regulator [Candidatus Woesebacteria bacterium]MBP6883053.1 helix-turn-helix transcriptional regulator [Candidatus Woesebacteria bacterium]QQR63870.1 MAG: helix-turn-helix transcriptional regulator [Candidatus Roizmanbacteria bacterium]
MNGIITSNVHKLRKDNGVTQEHLAEAVGVTRQTVIAIEKGNYSPSLLLGFKIARYFKTNVEKAFTFKNV